jgi:hypothetical protein
VNTPIFTRDKLFTKILLAAVCGLVFSQSASADWTIDFSRRARANRETDLSTAGQTGVNGGGRNPASLKAADPSAITEEESAGQQKSKGLFDVLFDAGEAVQDIVILQTDKGFLPATVRVRKNGRYRISVVNVNEKEKNVSFILDGFSEHHATYYGKIKTFLLEPKKEGTYSFQSPETSAEGKLVVFNPQVTMRAPASVGANGEGQ